jgi:hypothetical protein
MTRRGDKPPPGARSNTAADQAEWDALLAEFDAHVAAQAATKKIELEHSMSRKDPQTPAEIAAEMIVAGQHLPIDERYQQRTYQVLLQRGQPVAEAQSNAAFWAKLKATDPLHVFGPADDFRDPLAALSEAGVAAGPSITQDPITGVKTYTPGYQPTAAATGLPAAGPPTVLEYSRSQWLGMSQPVNRFSLNPGGEYYAVIPGTPPSMFLAGDLPLATGSGIEPSMLRWTSWQLRHTAAFTESRGKVAQLIELSLEGDPEGFHELISPDGRAALDAYFSRIATWVTTPPAEGEEMSEAEYERFYPPEASE